MLFSALRTSVRRLQILVRHIAARALFRLSRRIEPDETSTERDRRGDAPPDHWLQDIERFDGEPQWMSFIAPALDHSDDHPGYARFPRRIQRDTGRENQPVYRHSGEGDLQDESETTPAGASEHPDDTEDSAQRRSRPRPAQGQNTSGTVKLSFPQTHAEDQPSSMPRRDHRDALSTQDPVPPDESGRTPGEVHLRYGPRQIRKRAHATTSDSAHAGREHSRESEPRGEQDATAQPAPFPPRSRADRFPEPAPPVSHDASHGHLPDPERPGTSWPFPPEKATSSEPPANTQKTEHAADWNPVSADPLSGQRPVRATAFHTKASARGDGFTTRRRWPALPASDARYGATPGPLDELERARREWNRRERLNSEQRGTEWSESPS